MVARGEVKNALAHGLDLAGTIGHQDAAEDGGIGAARDPIVVIVQGAGADAHAQLARPRLAGIGQIDQRQMVEPAGARGVMAFMRSSSAAAGGARQSPAGEIRP